MNLIPYKVSDKLHGTTPAEKTHIVWHGTQSRTKYSPYGNMRYSTTTVIELWESFGAKKGAPYLIGRDGDAYKLYDDADWTNHLFLPSTDKTKPGRDKTSIPIMLSNEQLLTRENNVFYAFGMVQPTSVYKGPVYNYSWRGGEYWAIIDDVQFDALLELTLEVCKNHDIDPVFYNTDKHDSNAWDKATIFSHSVVNPNAFDFPPFSAAQIAKIKAAGIVVVE